MNEENALAVVDQQSPAQFKKNHDTLIKFVKSTLKEAKNIEKGDTGDYGVIPYTKKKSLLKPGAEKLLKLFGLSATNDLIDKVEDWAGGFVMYRYKCTITHIASGKFIADATRTCTNKESKHASKKVYDVANTVESVAQKRALVAATVQATMASEIFDADVSSSEDEAPMGPTKKDDDPRRVKVMSRYFVAAADRGFTQEQAKNAAHRKLGVESMTEITTSQVEDLTAELMKTFKHVGEGNKPEKMIIEGDNNVTSKKDDVTTNGAGDPLPWEGEAVDAEIVEEPKYYCQGPEHKKTGLDVAVKEPGDWCSEKCKEDYWRPADPEKARKYDMELERKKENAK